MQEEGLALQRLSAVHKAHSLRAAILALLLPPGCTAMVEAWGAETQGIDDAQALRKDVKALSSRSRLPCLESLLDRMRCAPQPERRALLEAARRVMSAQQHRGLPAQPMDRLHWLLMRHQLGDRPPMVSQQSDGMQLPPSARLGLAKVTAFLSRMVPADEASGIPISSRQAWYRAVMTRWMPAADMPPCEPPDGVGLAHAMQEVQALPWMLRPVLMRAWVDAAAGGADGSWLSDSAADALRLCARLLDSPLPPGLARRFDEVAW
jgi:hypothetical protein